MRFLLALSITLVLLVLLVLPVLPARAYQGGNPPIPVNQFGSPDMSQINLTNVGEYVDCIACIEIPGLGQGGLVLTYDLYGDNYGNTWVVPNTFTALYTAVTGYVPPGMSGNAAYYHASGLGNAVGLLGGYEKLGITTDMASQALDKRIDGWDALTEGDIQTVLKYAGGEISFWLNLNTQLLLSDPGEWSSGNWLMFYVFEKDSWLPDPPPGPTGAAPTRTPRPTPTPRPTAVPMPTPVDCPPPTISQRLPPTVEVLQTWPPNPVVKGQGGQGFDLTVRVTSYPVIRRWWTREERVERECVWTGDSATGQPDMSVCGCTPDGSPGCWPGWKMKNNREWYCQEHVEVIPDPIQAGAFQAYASLRQTSREWIATNLASKYPGARVHHPEWDVRGNGSGGCLGDGRCILETVAHFGFVDPGWYDMWVDGWTVGTRFTPPRTYHYDLPEPQPVYLMDTTLIPHW